MADEDMKTETQAPATENTQEAVPAFQLERCYMKDASVEMPHAPEVFVKPMQAQPMVDMQFEVTGKRLSDTHREVCVRATVTIKEEETVLMLAEVKQAGIFQIHGFTDEQEMHIANVVCPSIVFPYLRANVADLVSRTSMAPVHLPEMNFEALFQQRLAQQAAAEGAEAAQA